MSTIRLFVEDALAAGAALRLSRDQAHYLANVMRRSIGDEISLFNGRDGEWRAVIEEQARGRCSVSPLEATREQQAGPDIWLVFAPVKRARIDFIVTKATELGVSALAPVFTGNTAVSRVNTARLRANAIAAAEQCRRLDIPEIHQPVTLEERLADWPTVRRLLVCDESGGGAPLAEVLLAARAKGETPPWAILTGPEGGFTPRELDLIIQNPVIIRIGLGPRILRADTAAVAALACWQAVLGDWCPLE